MYKWKQVGRIIFYNESYTTNQHFLKYNSNYQSCNFPLSSKVHKADHGAQLEQEEVGMGGGCGHERDG